MKFAVVADMWNKSHKLNSHCSKPRKQLCRQELSFFRMWPSEFWHSAVLYMVRNVTKEPAASLFRVEVSRARIWLGYIGKLEDWGWRTKRFGSPSMLIVQNRWSFEEQHNLEYDAV
jgi:hypothetical protein